MTSKSWPWAHIKEKHGKRREKHNDDWYGGELVSFKLGESDTALA